MQLVTVLFRWKDVPEEEGLVACTRHNGSTIWGHREVKHPKTVTRKRSYLVHFRVLPNGYMVLGVTVSRYNLIYCF